MANESYKLSKAPPTSYTVFEEDQVLTSRQLNEITEYLDGQCRLTRVKLTGAGIVCGLEVRYPRKAISPAKSITVTKGSAVTTDGDILSFDKDRVFRYFKSFEDKNALYPCFREEGKQIPLFELLAGEEEGAKKLSSFEDETGLKMDSMVLLLYLESYVHDPGTCSGSDCDNKGKEQRNHLRVLLVSSPDIESLRGRADRADRFYSRLKDIDCERVLITPADIKDYGDLASCYRDVIRNFLKEQAKTIIDSYKTCEPLLKEAYGNDPSGAWEKTLTELGEKIEGEDTAIQYVYDFIKDLVSAYKEFKEALFGDNSVCCPEVSLFPKHVILGSLSSTSEDTEADPYRHRFHPSPLLSGESPLWERARFLHKRMDSMIRSFKIPAAGKDIKVTPSKAGGPLGSRAIPYYYRVLKGNPLHRYWNYELSRRNKDNHVYSYNADAYNGSARALNPLNYPIEDYGFFRIEGHLGKKPSEAEEDLKEVITSYNLPIKVTTLQIEEDHALPFKPYYDYGHLKALHFLLKKDLMENIQEVEDFNTKVVETIQASEDLPATSVTDTTASIKSVATDNAVILEEQIEEVKEKLNKTIEDFDHAGFVKSYTSAVETASNINRTIKGVTFNSAYTPYESLLNNRKFKWLEWIDELLKKKEEKSKELSLFAKFLEQNPGMEHTGGVEGGGTFVLVYSAASNKVVADFSLPYQCCVPAVEEEEEPVAEDSKKWKKWTDLNDFLVHPSKEAELEAQIKSVDEKINQQYEELKFIIDTQTQSITQAYSGSLNTIIGSLVEAEVTPPEPSQPAYTDPGLAAEAEVLEGLTTLARAYEAKIAAGTATEDEKKMREELDIRIAETVKSTIAKVSEKEGDITEGSEEERLIKEARNSAALIKNDEVRASLSNDISTLKTSLTGKTVLTTALDGFIMNP